MQQIDPRELEAFRAEPVFPEDRWVECLECPTLLLEDAFLTEFGGYSCPNCGSIHVVVVDAPQGE